MSRLFKPDYDHVQIARWLRMSARKGFQRGDDEYSRRYTDSCTCGVNLPEFPNSVSLILTRDMVPDCLIGWHLSICCVTDCGYRGFVPAEGNHWLKVVFGSYRDRAAPQPLEDRSTFGVTKDVRHWIVEVDWASRTDLAVALEGVDE